MLYFICQYGYARGFLYSYSCNVCVRLRYKVAKSLYRFSCSGRRLDRSLAKGKNEATESFPSPPQYIVNDYSSTLGYDGGREGYLPQEGGNAPYGYYTQERMTADRTQLPPNTGTYREYQGNLGTNMSSGESGIAGEENLCYTYG